MRLFHLSLGSLLVATVTGYLQYRYHEYISAGVVVWFALAVAGLVAFWPTRKRST